MSTLRRPTESNIQPAKMSTSPSKQISVLRTQITELSLLVLRQADIDRCFIATSICMPTSNAINGACNNAHSRKTEADRVSGNEVRSVRCDESECRNDPTNVAETNLDHVSTSLAMSWELFCITNLPRSPHRSSMMASEIHIIPTNYNRHS